MTKELEDISRIRDLLMGNNLSQFERKIEKNKQDAIDAAQLAEIQLNRQLSELRQSLEELKENQATQLQNQKTDNNTLFEELRVQIQNLDRKIDDLALSTDKLLQETQKWAMQKHEQLTSSQQEQFLLHRQGIDRQLHDIQQTKVDRSSLALLFSEIAVHLDKDGAEKTE